MAIGLGFVSICLSEERCSPAGTVTVKSVENRDRESQLYRIRSVARRNLENTLRIMHFLKAHAIPLYRMSAQLIPLATHPVTDGWDWWEDDGLRPLMEQIGEQVARQSLRISSHLPELCVLSTADEQTFQWTEKYLAYHRRLFEAMGLDEKAKIIMHLGGAYGDKQAALEQAVQRILKMPPWVRARLCLENDDKVFSAADVLDVCRRTQTAMVFDYHHHLCRNDGEDFRDLLPDVFATWTDRPPKIHLSSPRQWPPDSPPGADGEPKVDRAHADYVDIDFVRPVIEAARRLGDFDIMVEAKKKDLALFRLREALQAEGLPVG